MECIYIGVDKRQCLLKMRCEGIYQLATFLDVKNHEANLYSQYIFKRYFYNKLIDRSKDPTIGIFGNTIKNLSKIFMFISKPIIRDKYGIETQISIIEKKLNSYINSKNIIDPMLYFEKCGEAYGLILKKAAMLNKNDKYICKQMEILGKNIGIIITMRDSIQDLKRDRITGSYNPFFYWDEKTILNYYNKYSKSLRKDLLLLVQNKNFKKINDLNPKNEPNLFKGISIFAAVASNPYGICKKQLNPITIRQSINSLLNLNSLEDTEPEHRSKTRCQISENCAFDCCASKCENCCECGPKTEEQKTCCRFCDAYVDCCSCCGECADCA